MAKTDIVGGRIHFSYGGSNQAGNISTIAHSVYDTDSDCPSVIDKSYANGKEAPIDGRAILEARCVDYVGRLFGGATNADVNSDVELIVTNGIYGEIYGGNDQGGRIYGSITVKIQEQDCKPIVIDKLYAGGFKAGYSVYGYTGSTPRTEQEFKDAQDTELANLPSDATDAEKEAALRAADLWNYPKNDPVINVISATKIGEIYGGGFEADVVGSPHINVNMENGIVNSRYVKKDSQKPEAEQLLSVGSHTAYVKDDQENDVPYSYTVKEIDGAGNAVLEIGTIGTVFGGGDLADVKGDTYVEIGTGTWIASWDANGNPVWQTVDKDDKKTYTYKVKTPATEDAPAVWAWYDGNTEKPNFTLNPARDAAQITGNVYGGGNGLADTWACEKAMVGIDGDGVIVEGNTKTLKPGGTSVIIGNGTVGTLDDNDILVEGTGNVYGGGKIGRVERNTEVTIGLESGTGKPEIRGTVFGAGAGVETQGYSALVRGNSTVTIQGNAKIGQSVYGGGQVATVGRYVVDNGIPVRPDCGGVCTVTIGGNAEIGPDDMQMTAVGGPDDYGHVFGAGKGVTPRDYSYQVINEVTDKPQKMKKADETIPNDHDELVYINSEPEYLSYLETLALASNTNVTIGGNAFVKGCVFGGSENGYVQADTHVTIEGDCQIGNGYVQMADDGTYLSTKRGVNRRYTVKEWEEGHLFVENDPDYTVGTDPVLENLVKNNTSKYVYYTTSLPECASWPYGETITVTSGETTTTKTIYAPYDKFAMTTSGNEETYEKDTGRPTGRSTQGGRRTGSDGHTFYGSVFGGGSGYYPYAPGKWHDKAGSVGGNATVTITGGHILTSIYGANEMTNVAGDAHVTFGGTATLGVPRTLKQISAHPVTCYLFGAGKGDQRVFFNKQTNVQNVIVDINGGRIYGSVFGGGEDGHVMGNVTMNISDPDEVDNDGNKLPEAQQIHTKIGTWGTSYVEGNVFGGGRGFSGDAYTAGNVAGSVTMNITGGTMLGSVYGGGRLGSVGYGLYDAEIKDPQNSSQTIPHPYYGTMRPDELADDGTTTVAGFKRGYIDITISGGTIGNDNEYIMPNATNIAASGFTGEKLDFKKWDAGDWTTWKTKNNVPNTVYDTSNGRLLHTKGGNVFAGSMGRRTQLDGVTEITAIDWKKLGAAKQTKLTITGGTIKSNVYGGGEFGAVMLYTDGATNNPVVEGGTTTIDIQGGTIGTEVYDDNKAQDKKVKYTFGSVYGGGMGDEEYGGGDVRGNATVTMSDGHVWASVYGGGEQATIEGSTDVTISGGEIGKDEVYAVDEIYDTEKGTTNPGYVKFGGATMGNVYGAGKGSKNHVLNGLVKGNTTITIQNTVATADDVTAYNEAHPQAENGLEVGNILKSPKIYHNVYGGGALASVGTFDLSTDDNKGTYHVHATGIPVNWKNTDGTAISPNDNKTPSGKATVNILGGTIGISGRDNGMVNGSSRGDIETLSDPTAHNDPYDKVAWVRETEVNIGTANATTGPHIKGSVYGGGENGHNYSDATVNILSGTIGIVDSDDPWATFDDETITAKATTTRGNVYGAGCGTDSYTITVGTGNDEKKYEYYNPWAGIVRGNTFVNISGGLVGQNVYGGGSLASVGTITNASDTTAVANGGTGTAIHTSETRSFALSWPYQFEYLDGTGVATINIEGGHIGMGSDRIVGVDNGNIYGGSRGEAGDRYQMAHHANVKESHVTINFPYTEPSTNDDPSNEDPSNEDSSTLSSSSDYAQTLTGSANYDKDCIEGSVFGGGENGHIIGNTYVTMKDGFVSHSMFGGGRGEGKYTGKLIKVETGEGYAGAPPKPARQYTNDMQIFDWLSGKVYGNTHLTIVKGRVLNNVLGGGYMASVGVGNYAGGSDDFYSTGYGETLHEETPTGVVTYTENLWTSTFDPTKAISNNNKPDNAWYFLNSGHTYVNVFSGKIGTTDLWDGIPAGNVFGGCRGKAAPNLRESYRYLYNPEWLNGYANETHVTIGGGYECKADCEDKNGENHVVGEYLSLQELQELFEDTNYLDENNMPVAANWTPIDDSNLNIYGSVYGGAQDGRIRRDTHVIVNAGEIGLPFTEDNIKAIIPNVTNLESQLNHPQWLHRGNIYGAGSGMSKYQFDFDYDGDYDNKDKNNNYSPTKYYDIPVEEEGYSQYAGTVLRYTTVDFLGGKVHRNVYGGGSLGSVGPPAIPPTRTETAYKRGTTTRDPAYGTNTIGEGWWSQNTVNIKGTVGSPTEYKAHYGGEVYGASRGDVNLGDAFGHSVWTKVNVFDGATIMGNVFGGGDSGMVKRDSEVIIGADESANP